MFTKRHLGSTIELIDQSVHQMQLAYECRWDERICSALVVFRCYQHKHECDERICGAPVAIDQLPYINTSRSER